MNSGTGHNPTLPTAYSYFKFKIETSLRRVNLCCKPVSLTEPSQVRAAIQDDWLRIDPSILLQSPSLMVEIWWLFLWFLGDVHDGWQHRSWSKMTTNDPSIHKSDWSTHARQDYSDKFSMCFLHWLKPIKHPFLVAVHCLLSLFECKWRT